MVGPADLVLRARRFRKMFGGGMRQSGMLAAAAIHALDHHFDRRAASPRFDPGELDDHSKLIFGKHQFPPLQLGKREWDQNAPDRQENPQSHEQFENGEAASGGAGRRWRASLRPWQGGTLCGLSC